MCVTTSSSTSIVSTARSPQAAAIRLRSAVTVARTPPSIITTRVAGEVPYSSQRQSPWAAGNSSSRNIAASEEPVAVAEADEAQYAGITLAEKLPAQHRQQFAE